jgi:hypothetical protein
VFKTLAVYPAADSHKLSLVDGHCQSKVHISITGIAERNNSWLVAKPLVYSVLDYSVG